MSQLDDFDETELEREQAMRFQRCVIRAGNEALALLLRCARGGEHFYSDHELRACVALAHLARTFTRGPLPDQPPSLAHPDIPHEEVMRMLDFLDKGQSKITKPSIDRQGDSHEPHDQPTHR